jgi:hypothetical protein
MELNAALIVEETRQCQSPGSIGTATSRWMMIADLRLRLVVS